MHDDAAILRPVAVRLLLHLRATAEATSTTLTVFETIEVLATRSTLFAPCNEVAPFAASIEDRNRPTAAGVRWSASDLTVFGRLKLRCQLLLKVSHGHCFPIKYPFFFTPNFITELRKQS